MDGHFGPNITIGPPVVKSLRPVTRLPLEVHLMIENPDQFLESFAEAGADSLLVHQEGAVNLHRTVQHIQALGKKAGVVINPATPAWVLEEILPDVNLILVMTVNPGFGGQQLIFEGESDPPVELGRQADRSEAPYSLKRIDDQCRVIIARLEEHNVSRRHALVEPAPEKQVRVTNLSTQQPIGLIGGSDLPP